jgi:hypothetical protein
VDKEKDIVFILPSGHKYKMTQISRIATNLFVKLIAQTKAIPLKFVQIREIRVQIEM